jgi:cysteine desulfurase family protein
VIYLDNAATTYPKPPQVYRVWQHAMSAYGANPGRSGHSFSVQTSQAVYDARAKCAELFGADPENTVFTLNCTHALNMAIKGIARKGAHFVASDMEHNAVIRPIYAAAEHFGGSYSLFEAVEDEEQTVWNAERAIKPNTVALICTAASNVIGLRTPIEGLAALCRRKRICFILDAAQGGGVLPIRLSSGINIICAAGHKGLYGPMGTGLMISDGSFPLNTIIEGGTGSASESIIQPDFSPDRFESGTINTAGVIALGAGAEFVGRKGTSAILAHEIALCERFCAGAERIRGVKLYNRIDGENAALYAPVVSFNIEGVPSAQTADELSKNGIFMRGGLHCAPLAHKKIGTLDGGTVRFSPSVFSTPQEVDALVRSLSVMARGHF